MSLARGLVPLLLPLALAIPSVTLAMEPVPETPGWRGFLVLGAGQTGARSNFVAGNSLIDVGARTVDSVADRPRRDDAFHPVVAGEINYTFNQGWQAFFGTSLEDAVTLDAVIQAGARKDLGQAGRLQAGILFSGIQTRTWEDPYAEGVRREKTDRDSTGFRLQWDQILGSAFELTFSYRDISIDTERSGEGVTSLDCDSACQRLLRRDGDRYMFDLAYLFRLGEGLNHLLRPTLRYTIDDRKGDAVSGTAYLLQLTHIFLGQGYSVASNIAYGGQTRDDPSPIFGVKTDADRFVIDTTLFYRLPVAGGRWQAVASLLYGEDDADVSFHDNEVFTISLGAMYRFGAP